MMRYIAIVVGGVSLVLFGLVLARGYNYKFKTKNTVPVVGSAEHNFIADLIVWSGSYTRTSMDLKEASAALKADEEAVRAYLAEKGISASEVVFSSVSVQRQTQDQFNEQGRLTGSVFTGYQLVQRVRVESSNIEKVEVVSREITRLLQSGIELNSNEPQYYFTHLKDLKIDLLEQAAKDARARAETIARNAKSQLGSLRKASMGVFQITGQYSNEDYTYGGAFNTASKAKTATVTVRLEYELE